MKIVTEVKELKNLINAFRLNNPKDNIGFIPTMGALHQGHVSLIDAASDLCNFVITSIFVNPTQFNDKKDLERYPRTIEADMEVLANTACDVLFLPTVAEMYPIKDAVYSIDLNGLDQVMEGKFRQGHFDGVCNIVESFFRIIAPDKAFFGIKDFQQVAIIKHMTKVRALKVDVVTCPILRDASGLAMSSRNALLSPQEKESARILNWVLKLGKLLVQEGKPLSEIKENMLALFAQGSLDLEYLEIVDNDTLQAVNSVQPNISACIVAYCGNVRLIDNIQLN
ncbi:pantoate--beta-alanine ligase [Putridiphycobacter roseus]|uniref:pantoate--beta-alanine ligase n=1 Tax=Putridiphycobacter roseus TaxID=2219161 RepID=UPI0013146541|nr:pantoate--beta-alanine ligase [Putridiphycobacter roseus]